MRAEVGITGVEFPTEAHDIAGVTFDEIPGFADVKLRLLPDDEQDDVPYGVADVRVFFFGMDASLEELKREAIARAFTVCQQIASAQPSDTVISNLNPRWR